MQDIVRPGASQTGDLIIQGERQYERREGGYDTRSYEYAPGESRCRQRAKSASPLSGMAQQADKRLLG